MQTCLNETGRALTLATPQQTQTTYKHVWSMQPSLTGLHAYNHVSITVAPMPNIGTSALHAKLPTHLAHALWVSMLTS
jgi:hypothetical protein